MFQIRCKSIDACSGEVEYEFCFKNVYATKDGAIRHLRDCGWHRDSELSWHVTNGDGTRTMQAEIEEFAI